MTGPLVLYENRLNDAVPVASSTAAGYDVLNLRDYRDYTFFKAGAIPVNITVDSGSAKAIDYLAIYGHNLGSTGCTVELRKSTDNFAANDVLVDTHTPADDKPILRVLSSYTSRYNRVRITTGSVPTIAMILFGVRMEIPAYMREGFDPVGRGVMATQNRSVKGRALGKVLDYRQWKETLNFELVSWTWVRATWQLAAEASLEVQPFLFSWNPDTYPKETYHVEMDGSWSAPHKSGSYCDLQVPVTGLLPV